MQTAPLTSQPDGNKVSHPVETIITMVAPHPSIVCDTCGNYFANTPEQNSEFYKQNSEFRSTGRGYCTTCGGAAQEEDAKTETVTIDPAVAKDEKAFRRKMGKNYCMFMDTRVPIISGQLSEKNLATFAAMPYSKKCRIIQKYIEKGLII